MASCPQNATRNKLLRCHEIGKKNYNNNKTHQDVCYDNIFRRRIYAAFSTLTRALHLYTSHAPSPVSAGHLFAIDNTIGKHA